MNLVNIFEIENRDELAFSYRLLEIDGLTHGDHFARNLNLIQKDVAYEIRQPVSITTSLGKPCLVIPAESPLPGLERMLTPEVATLNPREEVFRLDFRGLTEQTRPIAIKTLTWALQQPLRQRRELWGDKSSYYWKSPVKQSSDVQMFGGFWFRVVYLPPDTIALCLDITHKYADSKRLTVRAGANLGDFRNRHVLYHFGHSWFRAQLMNPTGRAIRDQKFTDNDGRIIDVYSYTTEKCKSGMPPWVRDLDPSSPAIVYKYPGNEQNRYGAASLCKLLYKTADPVVRSLHRDSILAPEKRLSVIAGVIEDLFQEARISGTRISVARSHKLAPKHRFPVPDLKFGQGKELHVKRTEKDKIEPGVCVGDFPRARLQCLSGKDGGGTFVDTPFGAQYLLMGASVPDAIQDSFKARLTQVIKDIYPEPYRLQTILFDDSGATSVGQVRAIREALQRANVTSGYAVLLLPENSDSRLHNSLKRECWPALQFQCARAASVKEFYARSGSSGTVRWEIRRDLERKYNSYLQYLAFGVLLVNRKWPYMLANPQHYDLYIGIDVLNNAVGLTFLYPAQSSCHFHHEISQHKEKLSKRQIHAIVYAQLKLLLAGNVGPLRSVVFVRDGISHESERLGASSALRALQAEGLLPMELQWGTVEVHKQSAVPVRLFRPADGQVENPDFGDAYVLNDLEGFICTTGWPFKARGTVRPVHYKIVDGPMVIEAILEDSVGHAILAWSAPDRSSRLPVILGLCDHFLQPVASRVDEDILEEEDDEVDEDDNE